MKKDLDVPNILVGKIIEDNTIKCEIITIHDEFNIDIKILNINWSHINNYLTIGKVYPIFMHKDWKGDIQIWEIPGEKMKKRSSQLLLQWEKGVGWSWDLDS